MLTTNQSPMPSSVGDKSSELPVGRQSRRPRWLVAVVIAAIALAAGALVAILLTGGDADAPEDVVAQSIEESNARDVDALEGLYDAEIVSIYDASAVGGGAFNVELVGREAVLANLEEVWSVWAPTTTSYEVLSVEGDTVTTTEDVRFSDGAGASYRHTVLYEVSDDGLILREERVVEGFN